MAFLRALALILLITFIPSCSGTETSEDDPNSPIDTISPAGPFDDSAGYRSARTFFYSLPSPLAMAAVFNASGLKFMDGVCHDPKRAANYTQKRSQAVNLGIYAADLAYHIVNDQGAQALNYLDAMKTLSDALELKTLFDTDSYLKRFRNNINRKDSLAYLVAELKQEMDLFLSENEKENQALFIFSGSWIESVYIATRSIAAKPNDVIAHTIAEQKYLLDNLVNLLTDYEKEPNFKDLFAAMTDLKSSFDKTVATVGEGVSVTEVNESSIKEITKKISDIRQQFVTP